MSILTLDVAAQRLGVKPGTLRVFLFRHPDLARPRYAVAPKQHGSARKRLLTEREFAAIEKRRIAEPLVK